MTRICNTKNCGKPCPPGERYCLKHGYLGLATLGFTFRKSKRII